MSFREPNQKEIAKGDRVFASIPNPETATLEEIARDYKHVGVVREVFYSAGGSLLISVEGLEATKLGRGWAYQTNVDKTESQAPAAPVKVEVFAPGEKFIEASVFEIRAAEDRKLTRLFVGEADELKPGVYSVL